MTGAVPVVLFVFNRPDHLESVLHGLRKNNITKLYVFCDGPRNEKDVHGVNVVHSLIDSIDWVDVEIFKSKKNKGLSESIIYGLNLLFEKHDMLIVIEDDIIIAPGFYEYMQQTLIHYKGHPEIAGVTGLCYPLDKKSLGRYRYDTYFQQRFCSWGWGTWRDAWKKFEFDRTKLAKDYRRYKEHIAERAGEDMSVMAPALLSGDLGGSWDVAIGLNMLANNMYFVWPKHNMVLNEGIGTGSHPGEKPSWELRINKLPPHINYAPFNYRDPILDKAFLNFFAVKTTIKAKVAKRLKGLYNRVISY